MLTMRPFGRSRFFSGLSRWRALSWLGTPLVIAVLVAAPPEARAGVATARSGSVEVRLPGLPAGQRPLATLRGPGVSRRISVRRFTLRGAKLGRYSLTVRDIAMSRRFGPIRKGARAFPARRMLRVRLRGGRTVTLAARYGSIVNPGVVSPTARVLSVTGPAGDPSAVVLQGRRTFRQDAVLSIAPSTALPRGLLAHVRSTRYASGHTTVAVRTASIYEVAPVLEFNIPLHTSTARSERSAASCGGINGMSPYRRIKDISFSGNWNTLRLPGRNVPVGVHTQVHFNAEAGLDVTKGLGVQCSVSSSVSVNGMAGPIPVTAAIEGELAAYAGAGAKLSSGGSLHVDAGASTFGVPPVLVWRPEVSFSNPRFSFSAATFAEARASIGVGVKLGLGNDNVASATIKFGDSLDLTAKPGACSWDAHVGQFSAEGKLFAWTIESPRTPPIFTKNLWRSSCGPVPPPPAPLPPPGPVGGQGTSQSCPTDLGDIAPTQGGVVSPLQEFTLRVGEPYTGTWTGVPGSWEYCGLPPGLSATQISSTDMRVSGVPTTPGDYLGAAIVTNPSTPSPSGARAAWPDMWHVLP